MLWQKADQAAQTIGAHLSSAEAATALEIGGVLKTTLIDQPAIEYEQQMTLMTKQITEYKTIIVEIQASIAKLIAKDQELAEQIQG